MPKSDTGSQTRRKFLQSAGVGVASATALAGCTGNNNDQQTTTASGSTEGNQTEPDTETKSQPSGAQMGGDLQAGTKTDVVKLDPHKAQAFQSRQVFENVYEKLVRLDANLQPQGELAKNWEISDDGTTWTFTLREGVMFHPPVSKEMTSADVVYSMERLKDESSGSLYAKTFEPVTNVTADGDYTVIFEFERPYAPFLYKLKSSYIVPEGADDASEYDIATEPVGTGPFVFAEHRQDAFARIEAFDNYWGTDSDGNQYPYLNSVQFTPNPEASARITNLKSGQLDWISAAPQSQGDSLQNDDSLTFSAKTMSWFDFLTFNTAQTPLDDKKLRQAIAWSIDRESLVQGARFGWGEPTQNPVPSTSTWRDHITVDNARQRNVEKAKSLIEESNYDGSPISITVSQSFSEQVDEAEILQSQLSEAGINIQVQQKEFATVLSDLHETNYQLLILGWLDKVGPDDWFYTIYHSEGTDNYSNYQNEEVDSLLTEGRFTPGGMEQRAQPYDQAMDIVNEDVPYLPLMHNRVVMAWKPYVKNYVHRPDRLALFKDVWMAES